MMVMVADWKTVKKDSMTAFLVDKRTPAVTIPSTIEIKGGEYHPYAVYFDNIELGGDQVRGKVGAAFIALQNRFGIRHMQIVMRSIGLASRFIELMIDYVNQQSRFGDLLAERQGVRWWLAHGCQELEVAQIVNYRLARKLDQGTFDPRRNVFKAEV